ncbi:arsenate reductase family protein [Sporosarcina limicola]|uniref:Arsenate reductase n=1 Tax=Sporosarcina limicola TaxID=34101 RepID=A0A927MKM5_9BACL|nr:arsenate reductase family protein [Sporosarcina limicola]MBE1556460.1 arsenate reductase [Sporosarcina limicola]
MGLTYYAYPKCGTCRKAKNWLEMNGVDFEEVNITENPPAEDVLSEIIAVSGLELKKFFNVSGTKYREMNLKDKLLTMTDEEKISLLSSDGMLIKRPLVYGDGKVTVGFNEEDFENVWKN